MPETGENIIDQLFNLLEQLLIPNWSDLIRLVPWVILALVLAYLMFTALQWRRAGTLNRSRVPRRLNGGAPPAGVHLPGPSRWPFVVPIGAALLLFAFALPVRDANRNLLVPFNPLLLGAGAVVTLIAIGGWLRDAMREWRSTARAEHGDQAVAAVSPAHAMALTPMASGAVVEQERAYAEPPPGVHMPGPSPWPFFAPIAATLMLYGLIFSSVLLIGGIVLALIAVGGWLRDAGREYRSTEEVGHAVPETRDPEKAWPKRLVPIFAGVIAISVLITLAPIGLGYLNGLTPASAGPTAVAVPAVPEISASTAVSFDTKTLVVPAGRPFDLIFQNNNGGVPHNVQIDDSPARAATLFDGEVVTGPTSVTYNVPALEEGDYYFLCKVHPNMNGTVKALPGTGGAPAPGAPGPSGGAPGPSGGSPQP